MDLTRPYVCPKCRARMSWLATPGNRIRRGFLLPFDRVCPSCGQVCRLKAAWRKAGWIWGLGAAVLVCLYLLRRASVLGQLRQKLGYLYLIAAVTFLLVFFRAMVGGLVFVRREEAPKNTLWDWLVPILGLVGFACWGVVSHRLWVPVVYLASFAIVYFVGTRRQR